MERVIMSFAEAVNSAIRSETSSDLGTSPARSFASLIDSEIRSSNASIADFIPSPFPLYAFASALNLRTRPDVAPLFTNTSSLNNNIDCQEDKEDIELHGVPPVCNVSPGTVELSLPNGDIFSGSLSGNVAHGNGKYVWSEGDIYEGEWKEGKACGKGRFTWSSGATYEGEFVSGSMHGEGTLVGVDGDRYSGAWVSDMKQGFGEERYANGDVYEGWWRCNLQEGEGRYTWRNGNEYFGEWKGGVISGKGVLVWDNGNRHEGFWENGLPKGRAMFTWHDGTTSCMIYGGGGWCESDVNLQLQRSSRSLVHRNVKMPGYPISKGHKNYDLMLIIQMGIRFSVGKLTPLPFRELRPHDFGPKGTFWIRFPPEGSKFTPPHQSVDFRWKDYCPVVFKHLRQLFGIDPADYMLAICGNDTLRDISSLGKSGSFIFLAQNRFIIKTLKKSQVKVLFRMLPGYYHHVRRYENSLLTKILGVHCVKHSWGQKTRFIVMSNVFCSEYPIHQRFDLKGSSYGRYTDKPLEEIDETTTLKDLDLCFFFRLQQSWLEGVKQQLDRDCEFLEAEGIMDYSFLIGLHFRDGSSQNQQDMELIPIIDRENLFRLGTNMPAIAERVSKDGGEVSDVILCFGIVNILQDYDINKKLEHAYMSLQVDPSSISAVDAKLYAERFRYFMAKIFVEDKR
ncbi:hypothetical protein VNO78_30816 [Psophocarpus tetragonolobus]|uniref:1-phosphatidylinositol-4-phosphate 5-kinase n=1 Tax=Psophocarpus tetragonolobus TaxID=3891 RepID=A0AAN9RXA8_PSOTE